jgi:hypothetical protein
MAGQVPRRRRERRVERPVGRAERPDLGRPGREQRVGVVDAAADDDARDGQPTARREDAADRLPGQGGAVHPPLRGQAQPGAVEAVREARDLEDELDPRPGGAAEIGHGRAESARRSGSGTPAAGPSSASRTRQAGVEARHRAGAAPFCGP